MPEAAAFKVNVERPLTRPVTILIAEDSESNQALFSLYFKGTDYRLTFAGNGRDAVNAFTTAEYDLVIMDIIMPAMGGLDAIRAIRAHEQTNNLPPTPIVAISANTFFEDRERTASAGCTDFLAKPIRKPTLLECVNRIVNNRQIHDRHHAFEKYPPIAGAGRRVGLPYQQEGTGERPYRRSQRCGLHNARLFPG
eukprot:TRINITY_DN7003_c0_g1_i1.p3 TRINITY_DN7003_c0_g1~~TRINITY_DN7003_c0_g1_i1.p3  ORF type:complete len:195 (-),score=29.36 TRINITY_DN7003_c0_g1_i1:54-638(-)